jgi:hypothetical protein
VSTSMTPRALGLAVVLTALVGSAPTSLASSSAPSLPVIDDGDAWILHTPRP